jgi:tetratricopeptide (TPR) repeat protein
MLATEPLPVTQPSAQDLDHLLDLYLRGLCLQAYEASRAFGPLDSWKQTEARLLGGRLALNLGAPRLSHGMHLTAWRADRGHPEACYYQARTILERRGPLAAWRFLRKHGDLPDAPPHVRGDWLAFHAQVLGRFRDFDHAEQWLQRALEGAPDRPWIYLEWAFLYELEDRYEESLEYARRSLQMRPWYRPGVQAAAHALVLLHRDQDALDLLTEAANTIESGLVVVQLASLQTELGHHADARKSYDRYAELSPLIEKPLAEWLAARRSDAAYYCGDNAEAATQARAANSPFYTKIAEQLEKQPFEGRRVLLDVPYVRQHHQTCAPATLAALSRFWNMPADHLEVAAAICYDGTPDHRERAWAENNGWVVREFVVTWDSARALIDRGIPFTLTTIEPASAHLQAVIGYDTARNTLLIRDPTERRFGEFIVDTMLEHYRSIGPRGMAMVPADRASLFDGIDLPEATLYDQMHQVQRALQDHDRQRAADVYQAMQQAAPDQRLTLQARRVLALYDSDYVQLLDAVEKLLGLFPNDPLLVLSKLGALRELARRDERLTILREVCADKKSDPIFWRQYAQELSVDARETETVSRLLRRAIRQRPYDKGNFAILANTLCDQRRFEEALELYGFAACLDDKDEWLARTYYSTARYLKKTEETLAFLDRRFRRLGDRSSQPARTLYWGYSQAERMNEAFEALEQALRMRPDDGELILFAAQANSDNGRLERAGELLEQARGHCQHTSWLRTAANLASARGDLASALALWREVVAAEPLAIDANRALTQLLAETQGRPAALEHLQQVCTRFPYNFALHQLWISWLRDEGPAATEPVIRQLLAIHPADAWAHRELALALNSQGRLSEAFAELDIAYELEPVSVSYWNVRGGLLERAGHRGEALEAYRQAVRISVDNEFAVDRLMQLCENQEERRSALALIEAELIRQVIFGDGLLAYQRNAKYYLPPDELLASLQKALDARPDLWHAWSAVIRQQVEMQQAGPALELARKAVQRFPLLPALRYDLAVACRINRDAAGEQAALEQALQINPSWSVALRRLGELHERCGRLGEARAVLEQAVARAPLDSWNHGQLAEVLWKQGEREAALQRVQIAIQVDPGHERAWDNLRAWAREVGRPEGPVQLARHLTQVRPHEARSWLMLARMLGGPEDADEQLYALDQAIALNPRCLEAYDQKATILARQHRFREALMACRAPVWDGPPPLILRGRAAWVEAERGNFPEAIRQMRVALQEDPNYYWGWSRLTEWTRSNATDPDYLEAASHMVRLAPNNPVSFGYRGEARQRVGDRAGAKQDYQKAIELDPAYGFAGLALFDEQMQDNELDAAAQTLDLLRRQDHDAFVRAREVQLAARRGDRDTARKVLAELAGPTKADETWPLDAGTRAMCQAGWAADAEEIIRAALPPGGEHPRWGSALRRLTEVHERAGRLAEAKALLELAIVHAPKDARAFGYLSDVLWKMGERDAAVERLQAALSLDPSTDHAWDDLRSWTRQLGKPEMAIAFARQMTEQRPEDARVWLMLARALEGPDGLEEQLQALDRAIAIQPRMAEAHDQKVTTLARARRFDEAVQACRAPIWNGQPPLILRGRAAWVEAERGNFAEAIRQMRIVVGGAADYYWGGGRLTEWSRDHASNQEYLEASNHMVRLAPNNAVSYGYRGEAWQRAGDRAGAKADYKKALELDPAYGFGGLALFDEQMQDNELDDAAHTLELLKKQDRDAFVQAREVQLAARKGDRDEARKVLAELAAPTPAKDTWPLDAGTRAMCQAGWAADAEEVLRAALAEAPEHPRWGAALRRLAEVHQKAGRLAEARALLEIAVTRSPKDARAFSLLADVLWRLGEREAAVERVKAGLTLDPGLEYAWDDLNAWSRQLNQGESTAAFARQMTEQRPDDARVWLALSRALTGPKALDEQLDALDRAIAINPNYAEAYDHKAVLLTRAERYEDALQACWPAAYVGTPPLILRGRSAWVEAEQGEFENAIKHMKEVLAGAPDYYWGWGRLTEWVREEGENEDYLEATENLVRLAPDTAASFGYRGEARLRLKDRAGAKDDFRKAIALDPSYRYAALELFDECLADKEIDEAARVLEPWRTRDPDDFVLTRVVQLAAVRGQREEARKVFTQVAESSDRTWPLDNAVKAMTDAGWSADVDAVLEATVTREKVPAHAAEVWVDRRVARNDWNLTDKLGQLLGKGDVGKAAMRKYLSAVNKAKRRDLALACSKAFGDYLRQDTGLWGSLGCALAGAQDFTATADWMKDYAAHKTAQPWMLMNLMLALRAVGRRDEAKRVNEHALTLRNDYTSKFHGTWLALEAALDGDTAEAARRHGEVKYSEQDALHQYVYRLTAVLLTVQQAPAAERAAALEQAQQQMKEAAGEISLNTDDRLPVLRTYRQCVRRLAKDAGAPRAQLWSLWSQMRPWLPPFVKKEEA